MIYITWNSFALSRCNISNNLQYGSSIWLIFVIWFQNVGELIISNIAHDKIRVSSDLWWVLTISGSYLIANIYLKAKFKLSLNFNANKILFNKFTCNAFCVFKRLIYML